MSDLPDLKEVLSLPVIRNTESLNYCFECGAKVIKDVVRTDKFDTITGNPYQVEVVWCPNWQPPKWYQRDKHIMGRAELVWEKYR